MREGKGDGIPQIDIGIRQEKGCAICGKRFHCTISHTIPIDKQDTIPKLVSEMSEIIQREPAFQICDTCREKIQNPSYTIKEE